MVTQSYTTPSWFDDESSTGFGTTDDIQAGVKMSVAGAFWRLHGLMINSQTFHDQIMISEAMRKVYPLITAVEVDAGRIRINERAMVTERIYEVQTDQGPMQFVKGRDGVVTVYEIYDLDQGWNVRGN